MFARGRSQRAYRVYAEDDFLAAEDPDADDATPGDSSLAGAPSYTAPARRAMPGPLGGRVGVVLIALVAMAVSALVVHALRASLGDGGQTPPPATAPVAAATTTTRGRVPTYGGIHVQGDVPRVLTHAARVAPVRHFPERSRSGRAAVGEESSYLAAGADQAGLRSAQVVATTSEASDPGVPSAVSPAAPEFGFER
jgi:hypothetical protein